MEDRELVRRTLGGDGAAFETLVARYRDMIYGTAYHSLGNPDEAQDAAQETFVRAYARLGQLRDPARFGPWLRRMVLNACADLRRRPPLLLPEPSVVDSSLERLTTRLQVQETLGRLSEKTRLVVTLCYLGGYSHTEIAGFLEIPLNTVRSRLQHAKRQLRQEMQAMISDTLNSGKPDEHWTRQVAEDAMRRGRQAAREFRRGDAARHYEEALAALNALTPDREQSRLKMDALWQRGAAEDSTILYERSLALAQSLGDVPEQLAKLMALGGAFYNQGQKDQAQKYYEKALVIAEQRGAAAAQARCLSNLGILSLWDDTRRSARLFAEAQALFSAAGHWNGAVYCQAMQSLSAIVGVDELAKIIGFYFAGDCLQVSEDTIALRDETCYIGYYWPEELVRSPLQIQRIFWQIARLRVFLNSSLPVGNGWAGTAFSYSEQPLQASAQIVSDAKSVSTPAGLFPECLLVEMTTAESDAADHAPADAKEKNRTEFCGTRRAWFAPGVGLVQLSVQRGDGLEATIQLREYSVESGANDYLPLALGNTWTYGWANVTDGFDAQEHYRVIAHQEDLWYLEHYAYVQRCP